MDAIDLKILALLQQDATLSIAAIGEKVGLSQTPCWKRIQRLEADGVIDRRVAVLDPVKLGLGLTVFVSIETADHSKDWLERFADRIAASPPRLVWLCFLGEGGLTGAVGGALMLFGPSALVPFGIGLGIFAYGVAVCLFTGMSLWRFFRVPTHDR